MKLDDFLIFRKPKNKALSQRSSTELEYKIMTAIILEYYD